MVARSKSVASNNPKKIKKDTPKIKKGTIENVSAESTKNGEALEKVVVEKKRICRYCGERCPQSKSTWVSTIPKQRKKWIKRLGPQFGKNLEITSSNSICFSHIVGGNTGWDRLPQRLKKDPKFVLTHAEIAENCENEEDSEDENQEEEMETETGEDEEIVAIPMVDQELVNDPDFRAPMPTASEVDDNDRISRRTRRGSELAQKQMAKRVKMELMENQRKEIAPVTEEFDDDVVFFDPKAPLVDGVQYSVPKPTAPVVEDVELDVPMAEPRTPVTDEVAHHVPEPTPPAFEEVDHHVPESTTLTSAEVAHHVPESTTNAAEEVDHQVPESTTLTSAEVAHHVPESTTNAAEEVNKDVHIAEPAATSTAEEPQPEVNLAIVKNEVVEPEPTTSGALESNEVGMVAESSTSTTKTAPIGSSSTSNQCARSCIKKEAPTVIVKDEPANSGPTAFEVMASQVKETEPTSSSSSTNANSTTENSSIPPMGTQNEAGSSTGGVNSEHDTFPCQKCGQRFEKLMLVPVPEDVATLYVWVCHMGSEFFKNILPNKPPYYICKSDLKKLTDALVKKSIS